MATSAVLIGEVTLENGASVWYQAVLDGGQGPVRIGRQTNVRPAHRDCRSGRTRSSERGRWSPPGGSVPARTVVLGNPATVGGHVTDEEVAENRRRLDRYAALAQGYRAGAGAGG